MSEDRPVRGFHAVKVSGSASVIVTQGDTESLVIECDDNLLPHILTTVEDGVLYVRFERGSWSPTTRTLYRIGARDLESVRLSGATELEANALHGDSMDLHLSGSGSAEIERIAASRTSFTTSGSAEIRVGELTADEAHVRISGSGALAIAAGKVGTLDVDTSGSADLDLEGLETEHANLKLSGSGTAAVWVEEDLRTRVSGSGEVGYRGSPSVQSKISGSGEVYRIEEGPK